jgi:7,8-dihydropterin-6-yl-methyl-4-(beta-D-ribofuranosyl)aminobenzene 5'-phosphate synthase
LPSPFEKTEDRFIPDDFRHEQYLFIKENGKNVLISGCSHKGVIDIASFSRPDVLIGGFHFSKFPLDSNLANYAKALASFETAYYTCHCTGEAQFEFMKDYIKNLHYISAGESFII